MKSRIQFLLLIFFLVPIGLMAQHSLLDDEFNKPCSKSEWQNINVTEGWNIQQLEHHNIGQTHDGQMTMMPHTSSWFEDYRGTLIFKNISGDFALTTEVTSTNRAGTDMPGPNYSLAGTMIRTPKTLTNGAAGWQSGEENYVFLALGYAHLNHPTCPSCPGPHFEVKNTVNGNSNLIVSSIGTTTVQIRMVRIDGAILVLVDAGSGFYVHQRYNRQDMPDDVQIGFVTYTDWNKVFTYDPIFQNSHVLDDNLSPDPSSNPGIPFSPDLVGRFEYARFNDIVVPGHLQGRNFSNPAQVSDAEILSFLSYSSVPSSSSNYKIWKGINSDWNNPQNWNDNTLPTNSDHILIPNCDCDEVANPVISVGSYNYQSLILESGANLTQAAGTILSINLAQSENTFDNQGSLNISGTLNILNASNKAIITQGDIELSTGGQLNVLD